MFSIYERKSFTLVEMLIVVVIIGILATALIPRLQDVQGRARDVKRTADIRSLGNGLALYRQDKGSYPTGISYSKDFDRGGKFDLTQGYMTSIPYDPLLDRPINFPFSTNYSHHPRINNYTDITGGQYAYTNFSSNGNPAGGFALVTKLEINKNNNIPYSPLSNIGPNRKIYAYEGGAPATFVSTIYTGFSLTSIQYIATSEVKDIAKYLCKTIEIAPGFPANISANGLPGENTLGKCVVPGTFATDYYRERAYIYVQE